MKKLAATLLSMGVIATSVNATSARAEGADDNLEIYHASTAVEPATDEIFNLPYLTNKKVVNALKKGTYAYYAPTGLAISLNDTFDRVEKQWGKPRHVDTINNESTTTYAAHYGLGRDVVVIGEIAHQDDNDIHVDGITFNYSSKYTEAMINESFGQPTSSIIKDNHLYNDYGQYVSAVFTQENGEWKLQQFTYHLPLTK